MEKHINSKNLNESGRSTQKKQIFECEICDMIFPKLWIYKNHEKQYHSNQIDIKSEPKENLNELNLDADTLPKTYKIEPESCKDEKAFTHKNVQLKNSPIKIKIKQEPKNLASGRSNSYENAEKPFSCKFCAKSFRELNNMKKHLKVHAKIMKENTDKLENDENQKPSPQIGKTFNVKDLIHRLKDLKCSVCSKTFITKGQLISEANFKVFI